MTQSKGNNDNGCKKNVASNSSMVVGKKFPQFLAAIIVNISSFANGSVIGWSSPVLPILQSEHSPLEVGPISIEEGSWLGSLVCLGAVVATPLYLYISHLCNRKITGYLVAVPFVLSWILIICCDSIVNLYIARFIGGIGCGAVTAFVPLYISEIVEDGLRGALGSYMILFANAGVLFGYVVGSYVSYYTFAYIAIQVPIVYLIGFFFLPETPMYLVNITKYAEAENSLRWFRGNYDNLIEQELAKLISFVKERSALTESMSLKDMITSVGTRRALIIGLVLATNLQFSGIFAILSYTVNIFQEAGSDLSPNAATILIGFLQFVGAYISSLLVDKAGRKILLVVSNSCMSICLAVLGGYFFFKNQGTDVSNFGWLPVCCLSVYILVIAVGLAPLTFVIVSEIFEPRVKVKATTIIISVLWFLTFVVGKFYANLSDILGIHGCYWMFSICCILGSAFTVISIPETKNRSFESILIELNGGKDIKNHRNVQNEMESL